MPDGKLSWVRIKSKTKKMNDKDKLWLRDELDRRDEKHEKDHEQIKGMLNKLAFALIGLVAAIELVALMVQ